MDSPLRGSFFPVWVPWRSLSPQHLLFLTGCPGCPACTEVMAIPRSPLSSRPLVEQVTYWSRRATRQPPTPSSLQALHYLLRLVDHALATNQEEVLGAALDRLAAQDDLAADSLDAAIATATTLLPLGDPPQSVGMLLWVPIVLATRDGSVPLQIPVQPFRSIVARLLHHVGWVAPTVQVHPGSVLLPWGVLDTPWHHRYRRLRRLFADWWADDPLAAACAASPHDRRHATALLALRFLPVALRMPYGLDEPGLLVETADPVVHLGQRVPETVARWIQAMGTALREGLPPGAEGIVGVPGPWDAALAHGLHLLNTSDVLWAIGQRTEGDGPWVATVTPTDTSEPLWLVTITSPEGAVADAQWACWDDPAEELDALVDVLLQEGVRVVDVGPLTDVPWPAADEGSDHPTP